MGVVMRILLLGGTGAMGSHLKRILVKNNYQVFITSRKQQYSKEKVTYYKGDAHDILFLENLLDKGNYDVIVDFMSYKTSEFAERMQLLLESTDHYIFLSSARVYADNDYERIDEYSDRLLDISEDKEYLNTDEYALTKARQENLLIESGSRNWTIIRPYITYSGARIQLGVYEKEQWLYRALKGKPIIFSEDINSKVTTLTYGEDVAIIIFKVLSSKKSLGQIFNVSSKNEVSWSYVLSVYLDILEKKTGMKPEVIILNEAVVLETSEYQYKYDRLFNRLFKSLKVNDFLEDEFNYTEVTIGLKKCMDEFFEHGMKFRQINWKYEAMFDRISQRKTPLNEIEGYRNQIYYIIYRYLPIMIPIMDTIRINIKYLMTYSRKKFNGNL